MIFASRVLKGKNWSPFYVLWRFMRYTPWTFLFAAIFPLIGQSMVLVLGLIQQAFFNRMQVDTSAHHPQFLPLYWLLLGLFVAANFMIYAISFLASVSGMRTVIATTLLLRRNMLERILQMPGAWAVAGTVGKVLGDFRDDPDPPAMLFISLTMMFAQTAFAIAAFVILLKTNAQITLLIFLPLIIIILLSQLAKAKMLVYRQAGRETASTLTEAISEIFGSIQAIQIAGAEAHVMSHIDSISTQRMIMAVKDSVLTSIMNTLMTGATALSTAFILIIAALTMRTNPLHAGDLLLFTSYLSFISGLVLSIGSFRTQYIQASVSIERMQGIMQGAPLQLLVARPGTKVATNTQLPYSLAAKDRLEALSARNLAYHFPGTGRGIEDIHLTLQRGTITVITGRVGAGKTTCLRVLLGLLPKEAGEIFWNESPVQSPSTFLIPPRSAYTPQVSHLLSGTLKENILLGLSEEHTDLPNALYTAVLEDDIATFEQGLDTAIGSKGTKLSGGQIQRTAAACMLVRDAELYVFDDLSSALDSETEHTLWNRLFASKEKCTFLIVSHRHEILQRADHIIVLKEGKIDAEGSLDDLMRKSKEMQQIWYGKLNPVAG